MSVDVVPACAAAPSPVGGAHVGLVPVAGYLLISVFVSAVCIYLGPYRQLRRAEVELAEARRRAALAGIPDDAWLIRHDTVLNPTIRHHFIM